MHGRSIDESVRYFKGVQQAHAAGDPRATRALAECYLVGQGTGQSVEKAAELLKELEGDEAAKTPFEPAWLESPANGVGRILRVDFRIPLELPLPISGGWGYAREDAVVIDPQLEVGTRSRPSFDFEGLEFFFVEKRIFEESVVRPRDKLDGLKWRLDTREVVEEEGRRYDHLNFKVTGYPVWAWAALRHDWDAAGRKPSQGRVDAHAFLRKWYAKTYETEYWFDVTAAPVAKEG